jgi:hypothetical protein
MKTAMQKLVDYIRANFYLTDTTELKLGSSLLDEKKQIKDAFDKGYKTGLSDYINTERGDYNKKSETPETYYNNTFTK